MAQTNQFKIPECAPTTKSFREANQFTLWKSKRSSGIGPRVTFAPNVDVASDTLISTVLCLIRNASIHVCRLNIRFSG